MVDCPPQTLAKLREEDSGVYGTWSDATRSALSEASFQDVLASDALTDRSDVARLSSLVSGHPSSPCSLMIAHDHAEDPLRLLAL